MPQQAMPGRVRFRVPRVLPALFLALAFVTLSLRTVATQEATPAVAIEQGVVFSTVEGTELRLTIVSPPPRDTPRPAVVVLPGWGSSGFAMLPQAIELAKAGYVAVAADYRADWPEFVDDAQLAVRWVRSHAGPYGVDPERICAYGWSSGGQLAAMLAVRDTRDDTDPELGEYASRVVCAVDLAGPVDATIPDPVPSGNAWAVEQLGGTVAEVPEAYADVSPLAFVDAASAPMLIVHGVRDGTVPIENSRRLAAALQAAEVEVIYAELAGEDHGVVDWALHGPLALWFLDRHLHPDR